MAEALSKLPQASHPDLLVGFNKADDAGVFRINDTQALVQTVDFFPPIVDDPYHFGRIAAANALSDVFAMGGKPLTALNIVGFPVSTLPKEMLAEILRGGNEKVEEAGAVVVGGHSIKDGELKYGISVTGIVHPDRIVANSGARVGDSLFLTKPLGTGIITTGIKRGVVGDDLIALVIEQMATLNGPAAELMVEHNAHAATDITGFGLLGHALEMARASEVSIRFAASALPILPDAQRLAGEGVNPGGANDNKAFLEGTVSFDTDVSDSLQQVLFDPQTSGGLLIAIGADHTDGFRAGLNALGLPDCQVGVVTAKSNTALVVESR